jgi:flagellar biosynthesis protein FlhG
VDLSNCIERLSPRVSYLARVACRCATSTRKGRRPFLEAVAEAAPQADVILLHASAAELARIVALREVRPLLLADTDPPASPRPMRHEMAHAARRADGLQSADGLPSSAARGHPHRATASPCADGFLGAVLRDWACLDPRASPTRRSPNCATWRRAAARGAARRLPDAAPSDPAAPGAQASPTDRSLNRRRHACTRPKAASTTAR